MESTVRAALTACCRLAASPTTRSPSLVKLTTEGVVRPPSELGMISGSPPSSTATQLFVVPKSMPITLPIKTASKTEFFHRILFFRPRPLIFGALSIIVKNRIREIKGRNVKKKKSQSIFLKAGGFTQFPIY